VAGRTLSYSPLTVAFMFTWMTGVVGATWGEDMCELASVVLTTIDLIRCSLS
jgi:hypothetical protein